jgi:YHS domain-containing protein
MNDNIDLSEFNKENELKCSLCKERLFNENNQETIQELIDGSKYFFQAQKCFILFVTNETVTSYSFK